jgi:hypothetical protein
MVMVMVGRARRQNLPGLGGNSHGAPDEYATMASHGGRFSDISDKQCQKCQTEKPAASSTHTTKMGRNPSETGRRALPSGDVCVESGRRNAFSDIFPCACEVQIYLCISFYLHLARCRGVVGIRCGLR